ncbi:MAG: ribose-phosphate pyrophosphokinase [Anaerolineae bacterium]
MTRPTDDLYIFAGSSNRPLAEAICRHLYVPLRPTRIERFSNDDLYIQLGASVRSKDVFIIQTLSAPVSDHLLELLMMVDIARSGGASSVNAVIPYYSYGRSDKKDEPRVCITARLVADLLKTAGADRAITMTLHSAQVHGFFRIPIDHLTAMSVFVQHFAHCDCANTVLVSPDHGYAKRAQQLADALGLGLAVGDKRRISDEKVSVGSILGRDLDKVEHAIILDDEIATGGSIEEVHTVLRRIGVREFTIACTHGLFAGRATERIAALSGVREILATDTIYMDDAKRARMPANFKTLSVAEIFAQAIACNYHGRSIGPLFEFWPQQDGRGL